MLEPTSELGQSRPHKHDLVDLGKLKGSNIGTNKLSDKLGRRDIQFYDLYKLNEPAKAITELKKGGYSWTENVYDSSIYEDIEVRDFNLLFENEDLIKEQFGQTIKVKLHF